MTERHIRLVTVRDKEVTGYAVYEDLIQVEIDQETYDQFEKDAKKFGMTIDDALGNALYTVLKSGLP